MGEPSKVVPLHHKQPDADDVVRVCQICNSSIQPGEWMLDLFRAVSAANPTIKQCWVHERCAVEAVQTWLLRKKEKDEQRG